MRNGLALVIITAASGACASGPPVPDWESNAKTSMDHAVAAYLTGDTRLAASDFERARSEIGRTGRIDLIGRAELVRCAARVASLVFEPCEGFEKLRADSAAPERAYADYLAARVQPQDIALLPPQHHATASSTLSADGAVAALRAIEDPLSRLVAIGVLFQAGRANPTAIAMATDTASAQGWRRPLLAWLNVQLALAEKSGDTGEAAQLGRRIAVVQ
ncbi:MAG: hypothetical protein ACXW14_11730, partial [Burkholderiaceae bacterium]